MSLDGARMVRDILMADDGRGVMPSLAEWDVILVSLSGGKDSQAMLDHVCSLSTEQGVADRIRTVHACLGNMEWPGTAELVQRQTNHYGVPLSIVTRIGGISPRGSKTYAKGERWGDLLDYAEHRGSWPDAQNRWCTSEFKRGPIQKEMTRIAREWREATGESRACRILDCMGFRADESPARAKREEYSRRSKVCSGRKEVWTWLPIHKWSEEDVWRAIRRSGAAHHPAYDLGMPRLSCVFCIFAPKAALILAGKHNPILLERYVATERGIDHTFRHNFPISSVQDSLENGEDAGGMDGAWNM